MPASSRLFLGASDGKVYDVDVLAELLPTARPGWEFFGWHEDFAAIIGRKVARHIGQRLPVTASVPPFPLFCLDNYLNETSSMRKVVESEKSVVQRNCSRIV